MPGFALSPAEALGGGTVGGDLLDATFRAFLRNNSERTLPGRGERHQLDGQIAVFSGRDAMGSVPLAHQKARRPAWAGASSCSAMDAGSAGPAMYCGPTGWPTRGSSRQAISTDRSRSAQTDPRRGESRSAKSRSPIQTVASMIWRRTIRSAAARCEFTSARAR